MSTASVADRLYSYEDLAHLPDDGFRYEIIGGELIMSPAPVSAHQFTQTALASLLWHHVTELDLGMVFGAPLDVRFSEFDNVQPDVLFVSQERLVRVEVEGVMGAPDLVVEVLSPSTRRVDLIKKQALNATHGVPEYWIADTNVRTVEMLTLAGGRYQRFRLISAIEQDDSNQVSLVLPHFRLPISKIFAPRVGGA